MPTYLSQIDVNEDEYQNPQELVAIWGTIREDIDDLGGEISATLALGSMIAAFEATILAYIVIAATVRFRAGLPIRRIPILGGIIATLFIVGGIDLSGSQLLQ